MNGSGSAAHATPQLVAPQVTPRLTEAFRTQTLVLVAMVCLVFALPVLAQKGRSSSVPVISTGAGCCEPTGVAGYSGDGGPATSANLDFPHGVAVDSSDNFYIADTNNCLIRKVTASSGIITTVAGTVSGGAAGNCSYLGDGGPATSAQIYKIHGVAVDAQGNFYIADGDDNVIRKVAGSTGNISTAAGCCENGGNPGNTGYSGDGGPATSTAVAMNYPGGIAVDSSGNLYIADQGNEVIRMVTAASGVITTLAGCCEPTGVAGYSGDGGPATSAELNTPTGVAVDSAGNVYIADFGNDVIRKVTASTGVISTVAGNGTSGYSGDGGPATNAELSNPSGIAVDTGGNLYIADSLNQVIRKVTAATGVITTLAGDGTSGYSGDGGPATSAELANPFGLAVDSTGNVYIADFVNTVIRKVAVPITNPTTTMVVSSANPSISGQSVTFTATVSGGLSPTGSVGFSSNGTTISGCGSVALSSGQAQCTTSTLPLGSNAIVATYSGDADNLGSSGTLTQIVNSSTQTPTTTTVASSLNPSTFGQTVTFTALVSGGSSPTGVVGFSANGATISGCGSVTLTSSEAFCATSTLAVGSDAITAVYSGNPTNAGSSGGLTQVVDPLPATSTAVASSLNPSVAGQSVTFTAMVSGGLSPTGTVGFSANGTTISGCGLVTLASSQARCTTSALPAGSDAIVATYSGDANNAGSSGTLTQIVTPLPATTTSVVSNINPSIAGETVTFIATVSGGSSPSGTVSFSSNGGAISGCGSVLPSSGNAQCSTSGLLEGSDLIIAAYSGDSNNSGSSGTLTQAVISAGTPLLQLSSNTYAVTIIGGQTGTAQLTVGVTGGTLFAPTTLACAGIGSNATCSFSPSSVATYPATVNMTIKTTANAAGLRRAPRSLWFTLALLLPGLLLLPTAKSRERKWAVSLLARTMLLLTLSLAGCGSSGNGSVSGSSQTYSAVVTASAAGVPNALVTISITVTD